MRQGLILPRFFSFVQDTLKIETNLNLLQSLPNFNRLKGVLVVPLGKEEVLFHILTGTGNETCSGWSFSGT